MRKVLVCIILLLLAACDKGTVIGDENPVPYIPEAQQACETFGGLERLHAITWTHQINIAIACKDGTNIQRIRKLD